MATTTLMTKPGFFSRPVGYVFLVGAIVALWSLMRDALSVLIILALVVLLIMSIKNPLWALVALIASQLTLTGYIVATPVVDISLRLLLFLVVLIIIGKSFVRKEVDLGPYARAVLFPGLLFIGVTVVTNFLTAGFDVAFKDFRNLLVGLLFAIFIPAVIRNTKQLKTLCIATCIMVTASAAIGIAQHYNLLGMVEATTIPGFLTVIHVGDLRTPGMSESELELAYILSATLIIFICLYLTKGITTNRLLLATSMILMLAATYFTYTRSALVALALAAGSLVLFLKSKIRWGITLVLIFVGIFTIVQTDVLDNKFFGSRTARSQLESSISRSILWQAAVGAALDNPLLGIGAGQFISVSTEYSSSVDPSLLEWEKNRYWNWSTLGSYEPHNDFLTVWVSYGTIALVFYFWIHFGIMKICFLSFRRSKNRFIKGLSLGLAAALVTWVVNSFYHNITSTLPLLWMIAGFSLAAMKMACKEKVNSSKAVDAGISLHKG
jgi:O-antigen ligase